MSLRGKTILITGASRGIGRAIALRCGHDGANVGILARSASTPSHRMLKGTLEDTAHRVEKVGGRAFVMPADLCNPNAVNEQIRRVMREFGSIDAVVNNASAIYMDKHPSRKQSDLMFDINVRGTFHMIQSTLPALRKSEIGHIVSISPPLKSLSAKWIHPHPAYTMTKYAMTMVTLGYADVVKANTIWPKKLIKTAATKMIEEKTGMQAYTRGARIDSQTQYTIFCQTITPDRSVLDEDLLPGFIDENGIDDIFI